MTQEKNNQKPKNKKKEDTVQLTTGQKVIDWAWLLIGTCISASAVFFFLMPSHLAVASISGLAILIAKFVPLSVAALTMILNVFCIVLALVFLGKDFSVKTIILSLVYPVVIAFWENMVPDYTSIMGDPFLDLVCYLFTVSLGIAILFTHNGSTGGIDIITMIINKYFRVDMGNAMIIGGMAISFASFFVYDVKTGVLSVLGTYLNGIVLDHFLFGFNAKKKVCIVSPHTEAIRDFILNDLHSGATLYEAVGAFNYQKYYELNVIVTKSEYPKLMDFLETHDPDAFVSIYNVTESHIKPKKKLNYRV